MFHFGRKLLTNSQNHRGHKPIEAYKWRFYQQLYIVDRSVYRSVRLSVYLRRVEVRVFATIRRSFIDYCITFIGQESVWSPTTVKISTATARTTTNTGTVTPTGTQEIFPKSSPKDSFKYNDASVLKSHFSSRFLAMS